VVLDILVQIRRNASVAMRFFKRLLKGLRYKPKRLVTDGLRSYGVAHREVMPEVWHRTSRYLNNRAENSHQPTRRRQRQIQRFKSPAQAQKFLPARAMIYGHFRPRRHLMTAEARTPRVRPHHLTQRTRPQSVHLHRRTMQQGGAGREDRHAVEEALGADVRRDEGDGPGSAATLMGGHLTGVQHDALGGVGRRRSILLARRIGLRLQNVVEMLSGWLLSATRAASNA
jgi:hypothetical protein